MEHKNIEEKPGPSRVSDLIIITPDELAKLGLFQDIQATAVHSKSKKLQESAENMNPKEKKKQKVENLEPKKIILNQMMSKVKGKNPLTRGKIVNPEIKIVSAGPEGTVENKRTSNNEGQTILNSKFVNRNIKAQSSLILHKNEKPAALNWTHPPKNPPTLNPSNNQPKILNSELKFEKRKFVVAQKKTDQQKPKILNTQQMSGKKNKEASTPQRTEVGNKNTPAVVAKIVKLSNVASVKNITTKDSNKELETKNSKVASANDKTPLTDSLPLKNLSSIEDALRRGLNRILQKDEPSNIDQLTSKPAIVIKDSNSNLNNPSTPLISENKKHATFGNISKKDTSSKVKSLDVIKNTDYPSAQIIDLEDSDDSPQRIISPSSIKKEVNIISDTSVCLSNEELKHLVSKPIISFQGNNPIKISSTEHTKHIIQSFLPERNTNLILTPGVSTNVVSEKHTVTEKLYVSVKVKDAQSDLRGTKIDGTGGTRENPDTLVTRSPVPQKYDIQETKKSDSATRDSRISTQHSGKTNDAPLTVHERIVRNRKAPPKLLVAPKSISVTKADSKRKGLQDEEINVTEAAAQSESKPKKEKPLFKSNPHDRKERDSSSSENSKNTIQDIPKILHTSSDKNKAKNSLPSTSKMIDGPEHDRQQQKIDRKHENKNISEKEVELRNIGKNSEDLNNKLTEDTRIKMKPSTKLDGIRLKTNKNNKFTKSKDMENCEVLIRSKESVKTYERNQKIKSCNSSIVAEEESNMLEATDKSEALEVNNSLENIEPVPRNKRRPSKSASFSAIEKPSDSVAESKNNTTKTSDDINKTELNVSKDNTADSNKVNDGLENIESVPKRRGRPKKSTNFSVEEKSRKSVAKSKGDTIKIAGDINEGESNVSKDYKADANEKTEVASDIEHRNAISLKDEDSPRENLDRNLISEESLINKPDDSQVETSKTVIDACVKLPKKRGRPRKIVNLEEINEPLSPLEKNHEQMTSTPLPKKRGRKRKSSIIEDLTEDVPEPVILDKSRSGRKRKKVNYYQLENNITDDEEVDHKPRRRRTATQVKNSSQITSEVNQPDEVVNRKDDDLEQKDVQKKIKLENMEETVNTSTLNSNECESGEDLTEGNENNIKQDIDDESKNKKRKGRGKPKQYSAMMNSIFAAAVGNKSKSDSGIEQQELGSPSVSTCDSPTKGASVPNIVIDEHDMVTCATCENKINNDEWDDHNRNVHYCLAWREGDQDLDLGDTSFITRTLTPLMEEKKELKCNKCGKTYTAVTSFITHMRKCKGKVSSGDIVTCAVCKLEMEKNKWPFHKQRKHNNLAWKIGDRPLDLNDQSLVQNILNALYKAKKPLTCEKCGVTKKSVLGFLSHQSQCGRNVVEAQVECELCGKRVLPVSMPTHMKFVHKTPTMKDIQQTSDYFSVDCNASGSKRQAAKRAMLIMDQLSKEKVTQEYAKHFLQNIGFKEENFITLLLQKELEDNSMIKCKFNGCTFETEEVETLADHMDSCEHKPEQYYVCKKCLLICNTEEEIKKHIKEAYDVDIIDDDFKMDYTNEDEDSDSEGEEESHAREMIKKKIQMSERSTPKNFIPTRIKHPHLYNVGEKKPGKIFPSAFRFTMEFCKQYFSKHLLFDNLRYWDSEWSSVPEDQMEKYLPKYLDSCDVAWTKGDTFDDALGKDYTFKKFEIFETMIDDGIATIYCGGPINAMAWMPTPYTSSNSKQILAVAPAPCFEKNYFHNKWYNDPSLIQFWDFGVLKNKKTMNEPTLRFCLAVDFGPIWHLEWCPSGCYDSTEDNGKENKLARMGLLAVAGSDAVVYIYSIPFLYEEDQPSILEVKPLLKLFLVPRNSKGISHEEFYALKISWSMGVGHKYIAVGYTDGLVGLFDISTTCSLLTDKDHDGVDIIRPIKIIPAHLHYISALHLLHNDDGKRWLLTGSIDRDVFFWDLSIGSHESPAPGGTKLMVTDGAWLTNWLSYVLTYDASTTSNPVHCTLRSYRDNMCDRVHFTTSHSTIKCVSVSNWLNGIIQGNSAGEIVAVFPHTLFSIESEKHLKSYRYFFGCVKLINKHKSPEERVAEDIEIEKAFNSDSKTKDDSGSSNTENDSIICEPVTYNGGAAKYGVLFCDKKMNKVSDFLTSDNKPKHNTESELYRLQPYPMRAVNKIAFNPNLQASLYYATGYQCGFVRVTYMKFWENDPHLNK